MKKPNEKINISALNYDAEPSEYEAAAKAAEAALAHENALSRSVSIVLTDDETIHAYNREYRNTDRPTDVLSFPEDEGEALCAPPDGFLGDIMISAPKAKVQGAELGHSKERELMFLTVHGILHLLGYDHIDSKDESKMLETQRSIISILTDDNISAEDNVSAENSISAEDNVSAENGILTEDNLSAENGISTEDNLSAEDNK